MTYLLGNEEQSKAEISFKARHWLFGQSLNNLVSGGMNISLFFTWIAWKLELGSNAHV